MSPALLGLIIQVAGLALKWFGAKQATLEAFEKLVVASKDDGLISVKTKDVFLSQKAELDKQT